MIRVATDVIKKTAMEWLDDKASRMAAALSFFSVLSLAPLLLLIVSIAGPVIGEGQARQEIVDRTGETVGESGRVLVETILENAGRSSSGVVGVIVGVLVLAFGATGAFLELQSALNQIWNVEAVRRGAVLNYFLKRFLSFLVVLAGGLLLLASMVFTTLATAASAWSADLPGSSFVLPALFNFIVSIVFLTLFFALLFRVLPDIDIDWREVWHGAFVTAILFLIGNFFLGYYLNRSGTASTYGAFGSLVVVLLWIYYSAQIVLFGAEYTQVHARFQKKDKSIEGNLT